MVTGTIYSFPPHDVSPETKVGKDWCKTFSQAIDSLFRRNLTGITYANWGEFENLRAYGAGRQNPQQYMDLLIGKAQNSPTQTVAASQFNPAVGNDFARKGYMNVSWQILDVASNFKNVVLGTFEDVEHDIYADGMDEKSSAEREEMKWQLWVQKENAEFMAMVEAETGLKMSKPDFIPQTMQELNIFSEMGGFKLKSEASIEEAIKYTLWYSEWKEIKRKIFCDLFDCGVAVVKDSVDQLTKKVKAEYCDVAKSVIPYDPDFEYADMPYAGVYRYYTIAQMRCVMNKEGEQMFTDEEIQSMAQAVTSLYGNPVDINLGFDSFGRYRYDDFRILVLDSEFKSDDYKYITERTRPDGTTVVHKDTFGKVRNSEKKKTIKTKTEMVYKCKWVVGTNFVWDYGHQFDIVRPTPSKARLSFHAYRMKTGSMVRRMIPLLDSIQLSWLKLQNAKAMAPPQGLAIEYGSLLNISLGNNKLSPLDILRIRNQNGTLLYQANTHRSYMPSQASYKPVQELQGGLGAQMQEYLTLMETDLQKIREIIGITTAADASAPGDALVGTTELQLQATQTTLKPMYSSYLTIKERMCKNVALRIQLMVKFNESYKLSYNTAMGKPMTKVLEIGAEINNAEFGIRIEARPSDKEKQEIAAAAQEAMRVGRQGVPLLNYSDYLMVLDFLNKGMTKFARAYIAAKEQEAQKRQEQQQADAIKMQGEQNAQLQQMQGEQAAQKLQGETEKAKMIEEEKRKTVAFQHQCDMEYLRAEKGLDLQQAVVQQTMENKQAESDNEVTLEVADMQIESQEKIAKERPKTVAK